MIALVVLLVVALTMAVWSQLTLINCAMEREGELKLTTIELLTSAINVITSLISLTLLIKLSV